MKKLLSVLFFLAGCDPKPVWVDFGRPADLGAIDSGVATAPEDAGPIVDSGSSVRDPGLGVPIVADAVAAGGSAALSPGAGGASSSDGSFGAGGMREASLAPPKRADVGPPDACVSTRHTNGIGAVWLDCVPLGSWNEVQAMKACSASFGGCASNRPDASCQNVGAVVANLGGQLYLWVYEAPASAGVRVGDVRVVGANVFRCPAWGDQLAVWS